MTANENLHPTATAPEIDASCKLPMLALLVGASVWLVVGTVLSLLASLTFHQPDMFANCPMLTYGRAVAAGNDALVYGFCIPAALAVILWIFSRLSQVVFTLPVVPVVAAHIWHLGVLVGVVSILIGDSTGFTWLEFPRGGSVLLFVGFLLIAISVAATFGYRRERMLYPSHWFLLAALLLFPWAYSSANIFLVAMPVRGVAQSVIDLWFGNNLLFLWFSLVALGIGFYFLPKLSERPLYTYFYALYAFWTLLLFGTWCGIPEGSPFPSWIPSLSKFAEFLLFIPVLVVAVIFIGTIKGSTVNCKGGPLCYMKVGIGSFIVSALCMHLNAGCLSKLAEFTWFGQAQVQLQIFGVLGMTLFGAVYYIMPRAMGYDFTVSSRIQSWCYLIGLPLFIISLAVAGIEQGENAYNPDAAMMGLRISTGGLTFILIGNLIFAANILIMFLKWKISLAKTVFAAVTAPLKASEVKP